MAETLGALIIAGFTASTGVEVGATTLGISTAGLVGGAALGAGAIGLNLALASQQKQPKPGNGLVSIRQPNPVRQGIYGCDRAAGSYMLYNTVPPTGVSSIDILANVSGQVCGYRQFFLNDDAVTLAGSTVTAQPDGRYAGSLIALDWRVGLPVETAYLAALISVPALWTADHRGDGIASMNLYCTQAPNVNQQTGVYPNGLPNPSAAIEGFPIWDPRDGAQNPDDPETWIAYPTYSAGTTYVAGARVVFGTLSCAPAYSGATTYAKYARASFGGVDYFSRIAGNIGSTPGNDITKWLPIGTPYYSRVGGNIGHAPNTSPAYWCSIIANPVLQYLDFVTNSDHGKGLSRAILITPKLANWIEKANLCDALVPDKTGNLGPRYTSNGKWNFDDDPASIDGWILATCDGWVAEDVDGSLALEVGAYLSSSLTIANRQILWWTIAYGLPDERAINELTLSFTDPDNKYQEVAGQAWRDEADISSRGRIRSQPLPLTWVQRHSQARRLAKRTMARILAAHGTITLGFDGGLEALGKRWVATVHAFLPPFMELAEGTIDVAAQTVTFNWIKIDPATIDAWSPVAEEGSGPF